VNVEGNGAGISAPAWRRAREAANAGDAAGALALLEQVALEGLDEADRLETALCRAACLVRLGRAGEAAEPLAVARALAPRDWRVADAEGTALSAAGKPAGAVEKHREACRLAPAEPAGALAWFNLADALERAGDAAPLDETLDAYRRAIDLDREFAPPHDRLGKLMLRAGDPAAAAAAFEELSHVRPRWPGLYLAWGDALAAAGDRDGAMARYRTCVGTDTEREVPALVRLARLLREGGDLASARAALGEALHEDPFYFLAHAESGMCLLEQGRTAEAAAELARALQLLELSAEGPAHRAWIEEALRGARAQD
jgi:tetratricopeptide (TPR) repeat protein